MWLACDPDGDAIMASIARSLNPQQIEDVSAYFASIDAPTLWVSRGDVRDVLGLNLGIIIG
ncbi:c-type cytochrome [Afipia birgiae]|jgi:hypothetical protein|uniref:c-type cytochrome n=1 Tax=Afipia birgiae TaxID=151414 RepID=UPI0002FAD8D4|nr:hypothetical protein [Afipia birgiae]